MNRFRFGLVCLLTFFSSASLADMQHVGAQNPLSGAWVVTPGDTGVTASPQAPDADFPDVYAWQINSNTGGRLRY
ncbi:MAG: hypothetical protein V2I41_17370, partial [Pseudomonadales bacterium]|nr:hypothetical protein [Pseudomonadales bacterium]